MILKNVEVLAGFGFGVPSPDPPEQASDLETGRKSGAALLPGGALGTSASGGSAGPGRAAATSEMRSRG